MYGWTITDIQQMSYITYDTPEEARKAAESELNDYLESRDYPNESGRFMINIYKVVEQVEIETRLVIERTIIPCITV